MPSELEWLLISLEELTLDEIRGDTSDGELQVLQREGERLAGLAASELNARRKARAAQQTLPLDGDPA